MLVLSKVVIPVIFLIAVLEELKLLEPIAAVFYPFLRFFGLPGEAALPLLLGFFVNIYASLGAIALLSLSSRQITVIAIMLLTSHSLLLEAPVLKIAGLPMSKSIPVRIVSAFLFGFILNGFYMLTGL